MITYTYRCSECDYTFDIKQKISEDPLKECPECKKESLKKLINASGGFQLKGKGWFNNGGY